MQLRKIYPHLSFFIPTLICLLFYSLTRSQQLTWANYANDSGDFLAAILTKGVPHPTGYPTYLLVAALLQKLPFGDAYFRAVIASLLPAAISAGLVAYVSWRYLIPEKDWRGRLLSTLAGLLWGLSPFLWSQALIVEVQGAQTLFIVLALWLCLFLYEETNQDLHRWVLFFLAFCFGLGLGNHVTLIFFLPAVMAGNWFAMKRGLRLSTIQLQVGLLLLGLLVYLTIPLRAASLPAINWGNGSTWQGFWWLISGQAYQRLLLNVNLSEILNRLSALASIIRIQMGIPAILLSVYGIIQMEFRHRATRYLFLYIFGAYALFAILYGTDDSIVYLLPTFLMVVVWTISALGRLFPWRWENLPAGNALAVGVFVVFLFNIPGTYHAVDVSQNNNAARFAEQTLAELPQGAILLTSADPDSFPLWYYHVGLHYRRDITVIVLPLTQFRWYQQSLVSTYPAINFPAVMSEFGNQVQTWGQMVPGINPDHIACRSKIHRESEFLIETTCSDDSIIRFRMPLE